MSYQMTPAAERAVAAAARWSLGPDGDVVPIGPIELILGLLHEPECRAARLLGAAGINSDAVRNRWPDLVPANGDSTATSATRGLSAAVESSFRDACERLDESLRSFQFATEHLLLGLALAENDAGAWLRERGVDAEAIERDHARIYGGERTPIDVADLEPIPLVESSPHSIVHDEPLPPAPADAPPTETAPTVMRRTTARDARLTTIRILDAAANRAGEALRVVEDHVRFVLNDATLVREFKEMRHELTAALSFLSIAERLTARNTVGDVGTTVTTTGEQTRRDPEDVAGANVRRLQESLRSLEEYAKLIDPAAASRCEALRYRAYTLQKSLFSAGAGLPSIAAARLYVLVDGRADEASFEQLIRTLVAAGVDVVQLRDKRLDDRALLSRARRMRDLTRGTRTLFIMNDRPDLAVLTDADGVHVGQEEMSVAEARRIVGPTRLVGLSTHSIEQARQAVVDGADYVGVGPVFPGATKQFDAYPGLDLVRAVVAEIRLPAFAIGGITIANVDEVVRSGLHRVAVSGAVANAADPANAARAIAARLRD